MKNFIQETLPGDNFSNVAAKAKERAVLSSIKTRLTEFDFNGVKCIVSKTTNLDSLYRDYTNAHIMKWETIGPDCVAEYSDVINKKIKAYKKKSDEKYAEKIAAEQKEKANNPLTGTFKLGQLFSVVDGRLFDSMDDVYDVLNYVCNTTLVTHELGTASDYVKLKNPSWFTKVAKEIAKIEAKLDASKEMQSFITGLGGDEKAMEQVIERRKFLIIKGAILAKNTEYVIPQLKDEFNTSDFASFMGENNALKKLGSARS